MADTFEANAPTKENSSNTSGGEEREMTELTQYVQSLLQQMQDKFQTMSDQIVTRIDEMGSRIDELEKSISELINQAGAEEGEK